MNEAKKDMRGLSKESQKLKKAQGDMKGALMGVGVGVAAIVAQITFFILACCSCVSGLSCLLVMSQCVILIIDDVVYQKYLGVRWHIAGGLSLFYYTKNDRPYFLRRKRNPFAGSSYIKKL